MVASTRLRRW